MRTLVVEDDPSIASIINRTLRSDNLVVDWLASGGPARMAGIVNEYDLVILDLNVPEYSGMELCEYFRKAGKKFPILFLTVCDDLSVRVRALDSGADDYLIKPFSIQELRARVRALLRRPREYIDPVLKIEDIELNPRTRVMTRRGGQISLSRKEFSLLEYMMRNAGRVLSRSELLEHVWDMNADPFTNTIDVHINYLRSKIDGGRDNKLIQTVHGAGYKIRHEG